MTVLTMRVKLTESVTGDCRRIRVPTTDGDHVDHWIDARWEADPLDQALTRRLACTMIRSTCSHCRLVDICSIRRATLTAMAEDYPFSPAAWLLVQPRGDLT